MPAPALTVILPVYNGEEHLDEAIRSVLGQTFRHFELLVIDDGSTDGSLSIINRHAGEDPRITVITRGNLGLIATLNEGLEKARGEYLARMDADDIALPERFERQIGFLMANPECVLLGSSFVFIDRSGRAGRFHPCFANDLTIRHALPVEGCVLHPAAMFRRSAVMEVGGYDEAYVTAEEYELWRRLTHVGQLHNLTDPLLHYREWDGRVSTTRGREQRRMAERIRDEIWQDQDLAPYRKVSLKTLSRLPGEDGAALENLQRELAKMALRRADVGLLAYLAWDLVRHRIRSLTRRRCSARTEPARPNPSGRPPNDARR